MTDHTIPPRELVEQWASEKCYDERDWLYELHIANRAVQWGADQELEACCDWLIGWDTCEGERLASLLHEGRRPKPLSLKEQALKALDNISIASFEQDAANTIRFALEQLPE